ncbi:recombinase family protein [Yimella sp. NH-Cas1]|uniref:recombinase family protein n=1 Tax=Yimella sp. NH-Cas1 TaxID=2917726 RepID=UPI001EFBF5F4|nr:recombinase family protein [Yimella sp. NH-Cas1]MCG8656771.1 recombinase family protein [Yimella sp. NH-Cas1]
MIFGYTRTSTRDKQTDDLQRRALVDAGVPEAQIYFDQVSGSKATSSRPGWSALEARLRAGDELIVWRIDRIGRSMIDVITTVHELVERGIIVRSLSDGITPTTKEGRLLLAQMSAFAEFERDLVRERVQGGVDAAKARGVRFGRPEVDPADVARKVRAVEHLVDTEGMTVEAAAKLVGWSRATYYRHRTSTGRQDA